MNNKDITLIYRALTYTYGEEEGRRIFEELLEEVVTLKAGLK